MCIHTCTEEYIHTYPGEYIHYIHTQRSTYIHTNISYIETCIHTCACAHSYPGVKNSTLSLFHTISIITPIFHMNTEQLFSECLQTQRMEKSSPHGSLEIKSAEITLISTAAVWLAVKTTVPSSNWFVPVPSSN